MFTATTLVSEPGGEIARGLREMRSHFYSTSFSLNTSGSTDRRHTNTSLQRPSPGGGRRSWRVSRALVSCDCGQTASPPGPRTLVSPAAPSRQDEVRAPAPTRPKSLREGGAVVPTAQGQPRGWASTLMASRTHRAQLPTNSELPADDLSAP